jgi:uncharacterized damage-inducible protein DinB
MNELQLSLVSDAYAASPAQILEALPEELTHRKPTGAPHSIFEELWHVCFWQQVTLDWISGVETPFPASPADGFPTVEDMEREAWEQLCQRFFEGARHGAESAGDGSRLEKPIRCPSRPGRPVRVMTVREQLESLSAHNAYHLGRIVLLRQLLGAWPPPKGGFTW